MAEFYHAYLRRNQNTDYWLRKKEQLCELTGNNVENWEKYQAQMVSHICGDLATDLFAGIGAKHTTYAIHPQVPSSCRNCTYDGAPR